MDALKDLSSYTERIESETYIERERCTVAEKEMERTRKPHGRDLDRLKRQIKERLQEVKTQTDSHTDKLIDRQTDGQTDRYTDKYKTLILR